MTRCSAWRSRVPEVRIIWFYYPFLIHTVNIVAPGEDSGEDSGDEGERPQEEDDDDEDSGTPESPVRSHLQKPLLVFIIFTIHRMQNAPHLPTQSSFYLLKRIWVPLKRPKRSLRKNLLRWSQIRRLSRGRSTKRLHLLSGTRLFSLLARERNAWMMLKSMETLAQMVWERGTQ